MVEIFNQYFTSVFTVEDTEHISTAELSFRGGDDDKLCDIYIDESVVKKKLDSLHRPIDKAAGADDISPRVLIEVKDTITFPITQIMKCSLASGIVPDDWKAAHVTPVHKSG